MIKPSLFIYHKMFDTIVFGEFAMFNTLCYNLLIKNLTSQELFAKKKK
jgi:hypothetical protein